MLHPDGQGVGLDRALLEVVQQDLGALLLQQALHMHHALAVVAFLGKVRELHAEHGVLVQSPNSRLEGDGPLAETGAASDATDVEGLHLDLYSSIYGAIRSDIVDE